MNLNNKYIKANLIKLRIKLLNMEHIQTYLSHDEIQYIKVHYDMPQWCYQIAKLEVEKKFLDEYKTEYI